jgi:glycosyltransferase involved in cell wall biosynthesis
MSGGVLFVHNNYPGQFRDLSQTLVERGVPCFAIGGEQAKGAPGVTTVRYRLGRGSGRDVFPLAIRAEADLLRARSALDAGRWLRDQGHVPQLIIGHPGWGETALLSHLFPSAKQVLYPEFFYHSRNSDVDFDREFWNGDEESLLKGKAKNAVMAMCLAEATTIVAPTEFQASLLPPLFRAATRVIHEGVDTDAIRPALAEPFALDDGRVLAPGTPVITHVNNQMEPMRGLHIFARALPRLLAEVPDAQVVIIGEEKVRGYGLQAPDGRTWKQVIFEPLSGALDPASVVEAMASGCYVIGSDTGPVRDAIDDRVNGRLLPFFDVDALSSALIAACRDPAAAAPLRLAAREKAVARFSRTSGRAEWLALLESLGLAIPPARPA